MPFSIADVYRSQWKGITPCISIARERVCSEELPRRQRGDARKFALQGARGVIFCSSSDTLSIELEMLRWPIKFEPAGA